MEKIRVGIDLGTTNTLVCYMKNGKPTIIKVGGSQVVPSVMYVDEDNSILVGKKAKGRAINDPLNGIRSSKTFMGDMEKKYDARGEKFTPTQVATHILKEVKAQTIKKLKLDEDTIVEAVITVPAYFTSNQIDETKKAGKNAGLEVIGIITEPRAAAIASIQEQGFENEKIIVVDLGGGTFDICILEINNNEYKTLKVDGDRKLGGDDFDQRIYNFIIEKIEDDLGFDLSSYESSGLSYSDYNSMTGQVLDYAVEAKIELSEEEETTIEIINLFEYSAGRMYSKDFNITREEFYDCCSDLFEKVISRIKRVFDGNVKKEDISNVVLVGGSCYIPKISEDVEDFFNLKPDATGDRSTMVAIGACFIADTWDDLSNCASGDIISHSLGIRVLNQEKEFILSKILHKDTVYPCSEKKMFTTSADGQETVEIIVYEAGSDQEDIEKFEQANHDLYGSFVLDGIEKEKLGVPQIEVTFEYDKSRILTVTACDLKTKSTRQVEIEKGVILESSKKSSLPVDFMMLIDTSGSMRGGGLAQAKDATVNLAENIIDLNTHRMGVIGFGDTATLITDFTHEKQTIVKGVQTLKEYGGTNMSDGIYQAIENCKKSVNKKVIIILTDGSPNARNKTQDASKLAINKHGIDIITIGAGNGIDSDYLKTISSKDEFSFNVANISQLSEMFETAVTAYLSEI